MGKKPKTIKRQPLPKAPPPIRTMGVVLPRNELNRLLVAEHVCATQEFDHPKALLLKNFIIDLGNCYKQSAEQKQNTGFLKLARDQVYELDNRIAEEFVRPTPALFMSSAHGYILAELCEIAQLLNCVINSNEKVKK